MNDKELENYIQTHQELISEFEDLLVSDPDFNYKENEFKEWVEDYVLGEKK